MPTAQIHQPPHPLGQLIQDAQNRNGWSLRELQDRATELGFEMSHTGFARLKNDELTALRGTVIRLLAAVLGVGEYTVAQAALASMGVQLPADDTVEASIERAPGVSDRDRKILLTMLELMRA
ncbi:hypothetical protein LG293_16945 (plasmid) [Citricoccus nitrophenolicus]